MSDKPHPIDDALCDFWMTNCFGEDGFVKEEDRTGQAFVFCAIKFAVITARLMGWSSDDYQAIMDKAVDTGIELFEENIRNGLVLSQRNQ